ncbi:MAG: PfkB family carbohydrate kinase [Pseudomonadota bacterium]
MSADILCIGSVMWDVIGRATCAMQYGSDVGGEITRLPGGVALNIAMTCARFGLRPVLLSAVGQDRSGDELILQCEGLGLVTDHVFRAPDGPTDRYMAVEGANGVIAAIADARTLETANEAILAPLRDGSLATEDAPFEGLAALDGNLTEDLLHKIAYGAAFSRADLRVAPESPGKAARLAPFVQARRGVLYMNCEEAGILCGQRFDTSEAAALGLIEQGACRALVTHGQASATDATQGSVITATPPEITVSRLTGAGDTFMAAHIAAEGRGADPGAALEAALTAAAAYVSGQDL